MYDMAHLKVVSYEMTMNLDHQLIPHGLKIISILFLKHKTKYLAYCPPNAKIYEPYGTLRSTCMNPPRDLVRELLKEFCSNLL